MHRKKKTSVNAGSGSIITSIVSILIGVVLVFTTIGPAMANAASGEPYEKSVTVSDDANGGELTVRATADAGVLPQDADITVTPITGSSVIYSDVADKVEKAVSDNNRIVSGFLAYDISFTSDGSTIEPSGDVKVSMDWSSAVRPTGAEEDSDVSVLHLKNSDDSNVSDSTVVDLTNDTDTSNTASVVKSDSDSSVSRTDITVDSFSVFTIVWTRRSDDDTQIGNIKARYVDENGLELNTDSDFDSDELSKLSQVNGGIVDLRTDWAEKDGQSRVSGYTFDHAAIGSRNGDPVTGIKVSSSTETRREVKDWSEENGYIYENVDVTIYRMYYTSDQTVNNDSNWLLYRDVSSENESNNASVYLIYRKGSVNKDPDTVTFHHVNEKGMRIADDTYGSFKTSDTLTPESFISTTLEGYTYKDAHKTSYDGETVTSVTSADNVHEIWLVYTRQTVTKTLTIHYRYSATNGHYSDAYYGDNTSDTTDTITVSSDKPTNLVDGDSGYVSTIHENDVRSTASPWNKSLVYMSSHLGSDEGITVTSVSIGAKNQLIYHTSMSKTANPDENVTDPTSWTMSQPNGAQKGRSVVITKSSDGALSLRDSQNGNMSLNLVNDSASSDSGDTHVSESYKATYHGENLTVEYTVTPMVEQTQINGRTYNVTSYTVEVVDSFPSTSTDIYQLYTDQDEDNNSLWIDDDMKYSGLFRVGASDALKTAINDAGHNVSFEWHRIDTADDESVPDVITDETNNNYPVVTRQQTDLHWNIAYNAWDATWLDIEAEEGSDIWKSGTRHSFYVKLTYTPKGSTQPVTLYSKPETVDYYGELENGSFETPSAQKQYSNADYKAAGGVWQTTGPNGGHDIEIVNATDHNGLLRSYHWIPTASERADSTGSWAVDGNNFAELNAEAAGALYQDVITHPDDELSYRLSHRARGSGVGNGTHTRVNNDPEWSDNQGLYYDTMYLVIMPTKIAMTAGSNQTELKTQEDLERFIQDHGGFDSDVATEEADEVTYSDLDTGILIRKISSNEDDWHTIDVTNGYIAKGGLTRFFFVAGSTAADTARHNRMPSQAKYPTQGNFIDDVAFSQQLPQPQGFTLTVNKTFEGLTQDQVASLASNRNDSPFTITISNRYASSTGTTAVNDALDNARLSFNSTSTGEFTATAVDKNGNDLLADNKNSGNVVVGSDGTITMSWTFYDQTLPSDAGDQNFQYTVTESNDEVSGCNLKATDTYTITRDGTTGQPHNGTTASIRQRDSVTYNITNSYSDNPAYVLPLTGGHGTLPFLLTGIALILFAVVTLVIRRRSSTYTRN